jgi:hypothetical protein
MVSPLCGSDSGGWRIHRGLTRHGYKDFGALRLSGKLLFNGLFVIAGLTRNPLKNGKRILINY